MRLVGVDTGGTFTDFVLLDNGILRSLKLPSTPDDPSRAILTGLRRLGIEPDEAAWVIHGTTVGTNAILEGKGARVAYVTNRGFADVLSLARQNRRAVYQLQQGPDPIPVSPALCIEVDQRRDAQGAVLQPLSTAELQRVVTAIAGLDCEAVAINFLFSFLAAEDEQALSSALAKTRATTDLFLSASHEVLPEIREYERGIATWLNAAAGPVLQRYLAKLTRGMSASFAVMQSSGTLIAAEQAACQAARLLLSGPAGGIAAARQIGQACAEPRLLTFDMGGTSTDVALIDGEISLTNRGSIGPYPIALPMVDIHTIGAGGGSIAYVDAGGLLQVGPESAGADPGPVCYGRGGIQPTVTDANLVLGRIPPDTLLAGSLPLDLPAAQSALQGVAEQLSCSLIEAARGVLRIANEHMLRALRVMSLERGYDPRQFTLFGFGGAGGLHACELAELLEVGTVILPRNGGLLSAYGMLTAEPGRLLTKTLLRPLQSVRESTVNAEFECLQQAAIEQLTAAGVAARSLRSEYYVELRYLGQQGVVKLAWQGLDGLLKVFEQAHESQYGYRLQRTVELVGLQLDIRAPAALQQMTGAQESVEVSLPGYTYLTDLKHRVPCLPWAELTEKISGPAVVVASTSTVYVAEGWEALRDTWDNLILRRK